MVIKSSNAVLCMHAERSKLHDCADVLVHSLKTLLKAQPIVKVSRTPLAQCSKHRWSEQTETG